MRVAILTISDRSYHGERADKSGPAVAEGVLRLLPGAVVVERTILPDEREDIAWNLKRIADTGAADLVLTTGGTGLSPRDVTPQATRDILDYDVPGLAEVMRDASRGAVPTAILSRQVAAVCGRTLIVNLPGFHAAPWSVSRPWPPCFRMRSPRFGAKRETSIRAPADLGRPTSTIHPT